ncbi:MAG: lipocalin family protein [Candidatus Neomarinimicrobiota bacterium]
MKTVEYVDIDRYMGDWYVIANIPTFIEKRATNAIESYKLGKDGRIETTFSFFEDSPLGEKKIYNPIGFIKNKQTNAEWRMQFLWPFKVPFLIIELDKDYSYTVIGIPSRKYVWIMARDNYINDDVYEQILKRLSNIGFDISLIKKITQDWN